jgi:hypothetical protein
MTDWNPLIRHISTNVQEFQAEVGYWSKKARRTQRRAKAYGHTLRAVKWKEQTAVQRSHRRLEM